MSVTERMKRNAKRWIGHFKPTDPNVICPGFSRLAFVARCPHACTFCFLGGTYRFGWPVDATEDDIPIIERQVEGWLKAQAGPSVLNIGELSDSLAPEIAAHLAERLIAICRRQHAHALLLVSKSLPTMLHSVMPTESVIVSLSLAQRLYRDTEGRWHDLSGAPQNADLIEHALILARHGWRIRVRLDPMIDLDGARWAAKAIQASAFVPERITLGTLRFTRSGYTAMLRGNALQRDLLQRLDHDEAWGTHPWRLPLDRRVSIYRLLLEELREQCGDMSCCKETLDAFAMLGLDPNANVCNCMI